MSAETGVSGGEFTVRPLDEGSWAAFARLVEAHGGVWGGCWCTAFHAEGAVKVPSPEHRREQKLARVRAGTTHAALIFDGDECVGWCQFGSPAELPRIKHRREYEAGAGTPPQWRITCFFTASSHRRTGVAGLALAGALEEIARLGGGTVESAPQDTGGGKVSASFLHNASLSLFEAHRFRRVRPLGKNHWLVSREVAPRG